jgi:hypothetical protein
VNQDRVRRTRRAGALRLGLVLTALACLAPTPGDIGGCGATARNLDAPRFFQAKRELDCQRCERCGVLTDTCAFTCRADGHGDELGDARAPEFPEHCYPLVHDGQVCLRALQAASCEDYARYMSDTAPQVPSECNFCPLERGPQ